MDHGISISVSILSSGSDFDVRLDGGKPAHTRYNRGMQIVEFYTSRGSHTLAIEEKRAYKSRLWWLPAAVRVVLQAKLQEHGPVDERGAEPQYLRYQGEIATEKTVQIEFVHENDSLILLHGDIQEVVNAAFFDERYRGRLIRYRLLPLLALSVPLTALSAAMCFYSMSIGNIHAAIIFASIALVCVGFAFIRCVGTVRSVNRAVERFKPAPLPASAPPRSRR